MALNAILTGSAPKHGTDGTRLVRLVRSTIAVAAALGVVPGMAAEPRLLPNEQAFAFSARGVDERTVEARFVIADGYYLYRDRLKFAVFASKRLNDTWSSPTGRSPTLVA